MTSSSIQVVWYPSGYLSMTLQRSRMGGLVAASAVAGKEGEVAA